MTCHILIAKSGPMVFAMKIKKLLLGLVEAKSSL
jgi:hypothetical protein